MSVQEYTPAWSRAWTASSEWDDASTGPMPVLTQEKSQHKTDFGIGVFIVAFWSAILLWAGTGVDPLSWLS